MSDLKTLSPDLLVHVAQQLQVPLKGLVATMQLLDEGGTVPFIARYRKEATGGLDEVQIRNIEEQLAYLRDLLGRRETILKSIEEQGKLTPELRARIEATLDRSELEDLYLPYKPKRRTKATIARERGLEPLALYLWNQEPGPEPLHILVARFVDPAKEVPTVDDALEGARHIVAELISEDANIRKALRQLMFDEGLVISRKTPDAVDEASKFQMYYDYREPVRTIPSTRASDRRLMDSPPQLLDPNRDPCRAQEALRHRSHLCLPRESAESIARATRRTHLRAWYRPRHPHRLQDRCCRRNRQASRALGNLPSSAEERP
jgi:uncharacterized protein